MFWPNPAIIRFPSERVSVFIRSMRLCNDGEISSSVVLIITVIETSTYYLYTQRGWYISERENVFWLCIQNCLFFMRSCVLLSLQKVHEVKL